MLFADPTDEEEALLTGIVTIVVTDDEKIGSVHKPGESLNLLLVSSGAHDTQIFSFFC